MLCTISLYFLISARNTTPGMTRLYLPFSQLHHIGSAVTDKLVLPSVISRWSGPTEVLIVSPRVHDVAFCNTEFQPILMIPALRVLQSFLYIAMFVCMYNTSPQYTLSPFHQNTFVLGAKLINENIKKRNPQFWETSLVIAVDLATSPFNIASHTISPSL